MKCKWNVSRKIPKKMKRQEEARFNINQRVSYSFVLWAKKGGCLRRQSEWKSRYKGHQSTSFLSKRLRVVIGSHMSKLLTKKVQSGAKWSIPTWLVTARKNMKDLRTFFIRSRKLRAVYTCVYGKVPLLLLACLPTQNLFLFKASSSYS